MGLRARTAFNTFWSLIVRCKPLALVAKDFALLVPGQRANLMQELL